MLFFKRSLYFLANFVFFFNIAFLGGTVSSEHHGCKKARPRLRLENWERANEICSHTFGDIKDIQNDWLKSRNLSYDFWFGLRKRLLTKTRLCESADMNGSSYGNVTCARKLSSVCVKKNDFFGHTSGD